MSSTNGFGIKLDVELSSFDKINKEVISYAQKLSKSGQVKLGMDTSDLDKLKETFNKLSGLSITPLKGGQYTQIQSLKNSMGELLKITQQFNNQDESISTKYTVSGAKGLETQKALYKELGNLQKNEYGLKQQILTAEGSQYTELKRQLDVTKQMQSLTGKAINNTGSSNEELNNKFLRERIDLTNNLKLAEAKATDKGYTESYQQALKQQKEELDLVNQIANAREKSEIRVSKDNTSNDLAQAQAINKAKEEAYQQSIKLNNEELKMSEAYAKEQREVELLKKNKIELLNIQKQTLTRQYGNKINTSEIDSSISKIKAMDNISLKGLKEEFRNIDTNIKQVTEDAKSSHGALGKIGTAMENVGIYLSVATAMREIVKLFQLASEYTLAIDKNLTNIQMITGKSKSEVAGITDGYKQLGVELHTTNAEMLAGSEELLRAGFDNATSEKMMSASVLGSKVSGQDLKSTTEQLIAIKNAFDLSGDSMEHVVDVISKLDNTSATSFKEISDAIQRTAFSAQQAGTDIDTLATYITTVSEKTRKPAETIGESFKTIYARFSNIKLGNLDEDGKSINDTEKALGRIGIKIRDNANTFRDFDVVLQEFMEKVNSGSVSQVDYLAGVQALAGTRQKETLLSLVENMDTLKTHQEDLTNSVGSAKAMFDNAYSGSLDAKVNDLKRSFEGLYESILSSKTLGLAISGLTTLINYLPVAIGLATVALMAFKGESIKTFLVLKGQSIANAVTSMIAYQIALGASSTASAVFAGVTSTVTIALKGLMATMVANPLLLLAVGITTVVAGMMALSNSAKQAKEELKKFNEEATATMTTNQKSVSSAEEYIKKIEEINKALGNTNSETEKKKLTEELTQAQKDLATAMPNATNDISADGSNLATSIELTKEIIRLKKEEMQIDAQKFFEENKGLLADIKGLDDKKAKLKEYQIALAQGKTSITTDSGIQAYDPITQKISNQTVTTPISSKDVEKLNDEILTTTETAQKAGTMAKYLGDNTNEATKKMVEGANDYTEKLKINTALTNTNADAQNSLATGMDKVSDSTKEMADNLKSAGETIDTLGGKVDIIDKVIDEMSKYGGITQDTYSSLLSKYPEVFKEMTKEGDMISNLSALKDTYQKKQKEELDTAWVTAKGEQIASNATLDNDIANYNKSAKTKIATDNNKQVSYADFANFIMSSNSYMTNALAGQYGVDSQNWAIALNDKLQTMSEFGRKAMQIAVSVGGALGSSVGGGLSGAIGNILDTVGIGGGISSNMPNLISTAPSIISSGDAKDMDSASKAQEKKISYITEETDRYLDLNNTITKLNNTISENDSMGENKTGQEKINILKQQIVLYNRLSSANVNLRNSEQARANEVKRQLQQSGFSFNGSDLVGSQNRLKVLQNYFNNQMNGDNDSDIKAQYDSIKNLVDEYDGLITDKIPSATKAILDMNNNIISQQKEIADVIAEQRDKFIKAEEDKTNKTIKEINKRKKAIEDLKNEQDTEDELNEKQNTLNELQDNLDMALRTGDNELVKNIRIQIAEAQSDINKYISDTEYNSAMDKFDAETSYLDEDLQARIDNINKSLGDEELLKLVQNGVTDLSSILTKVNKSTADMPKTFATIGTILSEQWVGGITEFSNKLSAINGVTMGITANVRGNISNQTPISNTSKGSIINIKGSDINFHGDITEEVLPKLREEITTVLSENNDKIYKELSELLER